MLFFTGIKWRSAIAHTKWRRLVTIIQNIGSKINTYHINIKINSGKWTDVKNRTDYSFEYMNNIKNLEPIIKIIQNLENHTKIFLFTTMDMWQWIV